MFITILILVIIATGFVGLVLAKSNKDGKDSWVKFFARGKDAGFSLMEIELLRRLAIKSNLDNPSALFWSQHELDNCIRKMVQTARLSGGDRTIHDFLSKLYDYRKKVEMEKPKIKKGLQDTRQIGEGQSLRLLVGNRGVFGSRILNNTNQSILMVKPNSPKLSNNFSWIGTTISVYFWREDDAGYVFDTEVQDEVFFKGKAALKVKQGITLSRTQKRRSIRIKLHKPAFLYILSPGQPSNSLEMEPGLKCFIENLSDTGCGVLVGGNASAGIGIKVQFMLNNVPVCFSGRIRSAEYNEEKNQSLLHIEADPMKIETRNHILGEIFGMLPEEDDLPFRVLDEEAHAEAAAGEITDDADETDETTASGETIDAFDTFDTNAADENAL